MDIKLPVN